MSFLFESNSEFRLYLIIFGILFFISLFLPVIIYSTTKYTKEITVKEKFQRFVKRSTKYLIVDENDTIYNMANIWWKFDYNKSDDWVRMKEGMKYKVKGYGFRFPALSWYPNIYEYEQL